MTLKKSEAMRKSSFNKNLKEANRLDQKVIKREEEFEGRNRKARRELARSKDLLYHIRMKN